MRAIVTAAAIFAFILTLLAGLNLYILFEGGKCRCIECPGMCVESGYAEKLECNEHSTRLDCNTYSCRSILGRCKKIPRLLEFNTYLRTY
jgi:hypothetical protein